MTPERWKRVEELYHAARTRPSGERAAFLAEACRDDEALRRDVESLLNEPVSADGFLDTPAPAAAHIASEVTPAAMTGHTLGGYHLQTLLGAGGMGEVYRARDAKLGRDVAIKVLPRAFTSDPDRLARFEREARMLAALNHPNICAIYGLEEADGIRFLILELVDGETLAERIGGQDGVRAPPRAPSFARRPSIAEALPIARQIADALEAAHDKGIVHRDLKPANIKITPDGVVKVLDFGLAKADASAPDTRRATISIGGTRDGVILGTAAYMSPEQARGKPVDKRADIWAFGCVLYEMLTGRVAFAGETVSDTIGKILEREPDWSALPAATPAPIRRLLLRCLAKDPKQRLRDIGDVRIEIDAIDEVLPGASEEPWRLPPARSARRGCLGSRSPRLPPLGVWAGLGAGDHAGEPAGQRPVHALHGLGGHGRGRRNLARRGVRGLPRRPRWRVRHLAEPGGHRGFFQSHADIPPLASSGFIVRKLGFSADGTEIWFNPGDAQPLMLMPLTGGTPRPFLGAGTNTPPGLQTAPASSISTKPTVMTPSISPIAPAPMRGRSSRLGR